MKKKVVKCGIMPRDQYINRTIAIAKGETKPDPDGPKIWFESPMALGQVLCPDNLKLLKELATTQPKSISSLAAKLGRRKGNLSRTLKMLARYGIVDLKREKNAVVPVAKATDFNCEFGVSSYFPDIVA